MLRRIVTALLGRVRSLGEQFLLSTGNLAVLILAGRFLAVDDFAALSLAISSVFFVSGLQRSLLLLPFMQALHDPRDVASAARPWSLLSIAFAGLIALVLFLIWLLCLVFRAPQWVGNSVLATLLMAPPSALYEFYRRWHMIAGRFLFLWIPAAGLGLVSCFGVYFAASADLGAVPVGAAIAAAYAIAMLIEVVAAYRHRGNGGGRVAEQSLQLLKRNARSMWLNGMSHLSYSAYVVGAPFVVGAVAGPAAVAAFAATRVVLSPITTLISAVDNSERLAAIRAHSRAGIPGMLTQIRKTQVLLLGLAAPYLLVCLLFGPNLLHLLYGDNYSSDWPLTYLWILAHVLMLVAQPLESGLTITESYTALLRNRAVAAVIGLVALVLLSAAYGAAGGVVAASFGWIAIVALSVWTLNVIRRESQRREI